MSTSFIVITSIFEPTEAVYQFAALSNYQLIVAGDKKSPTQWQAKGVKFLSVTDQQNLGFRILKSLPYNHYCRKLAGYLYAMQQGANAIIDTDDDNIPYENWSFPEMKGTFETSADDLGFVNIYKSFTDHHIWPRGFPLDLITNKEQVLTSQKMCEADVEVGIWQGLADSDPDVDAIYRLVDNTEVFFDKRHPIVLGRNTICPFNSQNTLYRKELFALLYLPCFVTFRFTDILRGLVAQPVLWKHGFRLGFTEATVIQKRNAHNYLRDFESEIPCFLHPYTVINTVQQALKPGASISDDLLAGYEALQKINIVTKEEIDLLQLWLQDVAELNK